MKALPLIDGCALTATGLEEQARRADELRHDVLDVLRTRESISVRFGETVDRELLEEFVAVEHRCCSFFDIELDALRRTLRISSSDAARERDLEAFERLLAKSTAVPAAETGD